MAVQKPFEAPPEYSTDLPVLSVLRLDSPCQYGSSGDGNSHKRPSLTSINSQQPKKLCLDDSATTTTAYPFLRRCVPYTFHLPLPVQSSPQSAPAPASVAGFSSNASPKIALNPESTTLCPTKGSAPSTGCDSPPQHRRCNSVTSSGISSNAFRSAKNAPNSESATPCSAKGSVPPTGCSSLPPRPPRHRRYNSVSASASGIPSNASGSPKTAPNPESATPC